MAKKKGTEPTKGSVSMKRSFVDINNKKSSFETGVENAKVKSYSNDKKYVTKIKTDSSGNISKMKARRTVKGFLTGAPKLTDNLKKGGAVKKKK